MTKWFFGACLVLVLTPGCQESGIGGFQDDDDVADDDDDTDLGCNEASTRELGWDEEVEWWMDTAAMARDLLVGAWGGEIPWEDGGVDRLVLAIHEPQETPTLTTYPDADPVHAADACIPWASFPVTTYFELPYQHVAMQSESVVEISEQSIRWDLFVSAQGEDCDNGEPCTISIGAYADPDHLGTLPVRMTAIIGETEHYMGIDGYAHLDPLPDDPAGR